MKPDPASRIEARLLEVLSDLEKQTDVSRTYSTDALPFELEMSQIREYIDVVGEYGLAYETMVAAIESHPYVISNRAAIALLELGLIFKYKTERDEDAAFDVR